MECKSRPIMFADWRVERDTYRRLGPGPRLKPPVGDRGHRFTDANPPRPGTGDIKNLSPMP
jgi:hypothetical protein